MSTSQTQEQSQETQQDASASGNKCVSIIFNPVSGQTDPEERKKTILDALAEHGYTCVFIQTTKEKGGKELAEEALAQGVDLIAVSGGDGTVMEVMSALVGKNVPLAVLPAGTGNLLSVNLGIPKTVPEAVHVALNGKKYEMDLGRTSDGRHFGIMGGLGLDAQMIADAGREAKKKLGVFAYFFSALKNLKGRDEYVAITLDDQPVIRRRAKTVLIANMGKITGGLEMMPTASPNDGLLDIGILRVETLAQWLRLLGYAVLGRTHQDPKLEVYQAKKITIVTPQPQPIQYDGEDEGKVQRITIEILPKAVVLLIPEASSAAQDSDEAPEVQAEKEARRIWVPILIFGLLPLAAVFWQRRRKK